MKKIKSINCSEQIMILGDLHIGVQKDNPWVEKNIYEQLKYFTDYCRNNNINTIIQTGDWFDQRKAITHRTLEFNREKIIPLFDGLTVYVDIGNHDCHYKNKIFPNSVHEILSQYDNFIVINEPTTLKFNKYNFDIIPWICQENQDSIFEFIKKSDSDFCIGHFELTGFYFYKGLKSHGLNPNFLEKYKYVYSGHFHTISSNSNVLYVGTPYTITANDANDQRGAWIFNTSRFDNESNYAQFIKNPVTYHFKIFISEEFDEDISKYFGKHLSVIVNNFLDKNKLDKLLTDFENICEQFNYQIAYEIIDSTEELAEQFDENNSQKTIDVVKQEINNMNESDEVKEILLKVFNNLYSEALTS